jgi:hypothetical protein
VLRLCFIAGYTAVCWGLVVHAFTTYRINYLYVFEFNPTASVKPLMLIEYGLLIICLTLLFGALLIRSMLVGGHYPTSNGFPAATPYFLPALVSILIILVVVFPLRYVMRSRTRPAFWRTLKALLILPFGDVHFVQFLLADWGTSIGGIIQDFTYTCCYFVEWFVYSAQTHSPALGGLRVCSTVRSPYALIVTMIPFLWRTAQTMKMYLRTRADIHLLNHAKYLTGLIFLIFATASAFDSDSHALYVCALLFRVINQTYSVAWDILIDWGYIRGKDRVLLFPSLAVYIAAPVLDLVGRFYFLISMFAIAPYIGQDWAVLLQIMVEVSRRGMWSVLRVESENTNNLERYRAIDFVPTVSLPSDGTIEGSSSAKEEKKIQ